MSQKSKIIPPIKAGFNDILAAIASGAGTTRNKKMKRPQAKDTILIKSGDQIYEETCAEAFPDKSQGANGWKFTVISNKNYTKVERYFLVSSAGEEIGASIEKIESARPKSDKKRFTFSTLIANS